MHTSFLAALAATASPTPTIKAEDVSPGALGFVFTASVAVLTILLAISMVRKIRRVRYREQVREEFEGAAAENDDDAPSGSGRPARR
ncbi:hypothetical protein [Falsarthrobacter nasiphocae]|uniref:Transmembrane protein n=1 Tax=Falsarthrobacter nasiphocae TaxID=189863 RepID=A0AAE3YH08_9MICC|nr:hypothetical protein [Falsarthrobacter nasiphocae]MDR6891646.1 hypothetical protein [Falsarthrobacter nasiphocae]